MFKSEADMADPVKCWMDSLSLLVKAEFISPWGICDFVGLSFRDRSVARRLELGQRRAVTSTVRAALLLQIPDVETNQCITLSELIATVAPAIPEEVVIHEAQELVTDTFVMREGDRLQKVNGWMPLHKRLIAVELKLKRIEQAMLQAENNLGFSDESYVGLPMDLATRIIGSSRRETFSKRGIGLLGVTPNSCMVLIPSCPVPSGNPVFRFCCVEKFWRSFVKGN